MQTIYKRCFTYRCFMVPLQLTTFGNIGQMEQEAKDSQYRSTALGKITIAIYGKTVPSPGDNVLQPINMA